MSSKKFATDIDLQGNNILKGGFETFATIPTTYQGKYICVDAKNYIWDGTKYISQTDYSSNSKYSELAKDLAAKPLTLNEFFYNQITAQGTIIKDGYAKIKSLKGKTFVFNQICRKISISQNGIVATVRDNGVVDIVCNNTAGFSKTFADFNCLEGHKYLRKITSTKYLVGPNNSAFLAFYEGAMENTITSPIKDIYTAKQDSFESIIVSANFGILGQYLDFTAEVNIQITDLTQMYGEGNEPATVEEYEARFPNDYYLLNTGELISVNGRGLNSISANSEEKFELLFDKGKNLSQLTGKLNGTGNSVVVFPNGLNSHNDIYDEIIGNIAKKRISVDTSALTTSVIPEETYILDNPIKLDYKCWTNGKEEFLTNDISYFNGDVEYNFDAVTMIVDDHFKIIENENNCKRNIENINTSIEAINVLLDSIITRLNNIEI